MCCDVPLPVKSVARRRPQASACRRRDLSFDLWSIELLQLGIACIIYNLVHPGRNNSSRVHSALTQTIVTFALSEVREAGCVYSKITLWSTTKNIELLGTACDPNVSIFDYV